jgi:hypothetical protein
MILVNASAFLLVRREHLVPPEKTYFRIPFGVLIPTLGGISCITILASLSSHIIVLGIAVLFAGVILYYIEDTPEGEEIRSEIKKQLRRGKK